MIRYPILKKIRIADQKRYQESKNKWIDLHHISPDDKKIMQNQIPYHCNSCYVNKNISSHNINPAIPSLLMEIEKNPGFHHIKWIMVYGSVADATDDHNSDIDIAISTDLPAIDAERMRIYILGRVPRIFDIQIFENLPLYVQINVFKGNVLYVADEDALYECAYKTIREYEFFKPYYLDYIGEKAL